MPKQQPEKIRTWQGAGFYCTAVVRVTKGYLSIFAMQNILLLQHTAIEVFAQVGQRLVAATDMFAIHHPLIRDGRAHLELLLLHRLEPFGAKDIGQTFMMKEKFPLFPPP